MKHIKMGKRKADTIGKHSQRMERKINGYNYIDYKLSSLFSFIYDEINSDDGNVTCEAVSVLCSITFGKKALSESKGSTSIIQ